MNYNFDIDIISPALLFEQGGYYLREKKIVFIKLKKFS